ncbi:sppA [Symbiodinium sp. CCMP2592]|nr:sppA [Symbiodinium sp. CCMP2592]
MQGGAAEDLVHLKQVGHAIDICNKETPSKRQKEELVSPPLDVLRVEDELFISPSVDAALLRARELFALSVALPIAWLHMDANVESSRARKHERVKEGAQSVHRLQESFRCKVLDHVFPIASFFAEEEFYLLLLPLLFWCGDYRFARHMTYVVCFGLVWGNLLKDVFRLPRPRNVNSKVWVPSSASHIDSTACRMILGLVVALVAYNLCDAFDAFMLGTPHVGFLLLAFASSVLVLNPQPRPMTPTFLQNCTCCGLILGCAVGFRMEVERRGGASAFSSETFGQSSAAAAVLRIIIGYAILLLARVVLKSGFTTLLRLIGLEPNPAKPVPRSEVEDCRQEIKGWDLFAAAVLKTSVYTSMAWTIVCGAPAVFDMIGIPCGMTWIWQRFWDPSPSTSADTSVSRFISSENVEVRWDCQDIGSKSSRPPARALSQRKQRRRPRPRPARRLLRLRFVLALRWACGDPVTVFRMRQGSECLLRLSPEFAHDQSLWNKTTHVNTIRHLCALVVGWWTELFGDRCPAGGGRSFCKRKDDVGMPSPRDPRPGPLEAGVRQADADSQSRPSRASEQLLCFDAAISSCSRSSQWQHALKLVEDMQEDGLAPDAGIWDKLLDAMVMSGEMAAAVALHRENAVLGLTAESRGLDLHGKTVELAKLAVRVALLDVALSASGASARHAERAERRKLGLRADGSLSLIVGLGRQSKGEALLGPALWQMLSQELAVQSHLDPQNEGCLLIPSHELKSFAGGVARVSQESKGFMT